VLGDAEERSTGARDEVVRKLERAVAAARRRRRYRVGLALVGLASVTTFVILGIALLVSA
jgi:hypothetical protein